MLAPHFVAVMVCPVSKQPLIYFPRGEEDRDEAAGFLVCPASRLRFRITEGVPILLEEEGTLLSPKVIEGLESRARELGLHVPARR